MHIRDLNGKSICILGFGQEGKAVLEALKQHAPDAKVTIADANPDLVISSNEQRVTGPSYLDNLDHFDILIKSPGISPTPALTSHVSRLTTPTQLFFDSIAGTGAMIIGVTGSKGKSTTSSLIHAILKAADKDSHLVGNIGDASIAHLGEAKKNAVFVHELSSYQLMDLTVSPHIAVVTSFFPEHLDYHGSLDNYLEAKKHIARFQIEDDLVFFQEEFPGAVAIASEGHSRKIPFTAADAPVRIEDTQLIGAHNLSNIAAAFKVTAELGVKPDVAIAAIKAFKGLPHRLQFLGIHHGLAWVDDAISTTPESTIAALAALGDRVHTIILGGQDRGYDFTELASVIAQSSVKHAILFPGSGPRIRTALESSQTSVTFHEAASMDEAVRIAKEQKPIEQRATSNVPIVLLSTASPSYGMFKNFEDKGEQFQRCISPLIHP